MHQIMSLKGKLSFDTIHMHSIYWLPIVISLVTVINVVIKDTYKSKDD